MGPVSAGSRPSGFGHVRGVRLTGTLGARAHYTPTSRRSIRQWAVPHAAVGHRPVISLEHHTELIGRRVAVLVDELPGEEGTVKGRMATQAPEIDGEVTMVGGRVSPGDMVDVRITKADPYDLEGDILGEALLPGSP